MVLLIWGRDRPITSFGRRVRWIGMRFVGPDWELRDVDRCAHHRPGTHTHRRAGSCGHPEPEGSLVRYASSGRTTGTYAPGPAGIRVRTGSRSRKIEKRRWRARGSDCRMSRSSPVVSAQDLEGFLIRCNGLFACKTRALSHPGCSQFERGETGLRDVPVATRSRLSASFRSFSVVARISVRPARPPCHAPSGRSPSVARPRN